MATRRIIEIDQDLCDGCGLCVSACHEGAIGLIDGKATLLRDDYCDGLGDCLPACPQDAISFVEREASDYDADAVKANMEARANMEANANASADGKANADANADAQVHVPNEISTWPIQIKLVPINMPAFDGCNLLIAADCTAFAYGNFHHDFMKNHVCLIGCPKLDGVDYSEKLTRIIAENNIKRVVLCRMVVPCCGGLENAARIAVDASGKEIELEVITFSLDGHIL